MTVVKVDPYLFTLTNAILKAIGADRWDGNDWNRLTRHWSRLIRIEGNPPDATYSPLIDEAFIWVETTNGTVTISLPAANQSAGKVFLMFKSAAANSLTFDPDGAELINGVSSLSLTDANSWALLTCDGVQWKAALPGSGGGGGGGTDENVIVFLNGTQVGSAARRLNFQSPLSVVENAGSNWFVIDVTYGSSADTVCEGNDARLSDARTPLAHTHPVTHLSGGTSGDIIIRGASGFSLLPKGADGQVLKLSGGLPVWGTDNVGSGGSSFNIISVTNANRTGQDSDDVVEFTTGSSDRTYTLNAASSATPKVKRVRKVDGGTGAIKITPNGSDTINGYSMSLYITNKHDSFRLYPVGSDWRIDD